MSNEKTKVIAPLASPTPGVAPVPGYVPPLVEALNAIAVYDTKSGLWVGLPLQAMTAGLLTSEEKDVEDILDSRNNINLSLPSGSAVGAVVKQAYTIPAGGAWWIYDFELVTPASVTGNILISRFPPVSGVAKALLSSDQVASTDTDYDLTAVTRLGGPLRLVPGDIITVQGTVTVALTAAATVTLTPKGHVANQLV